MHNFYTDEGDVAHEVPDRSARSPIGGKRNWPIWASPPLVHCKDTDYAAFFSVQSCQKAKAVRHRCG